MSASKRVIPSHRKRRRQSFIDPLGVMLQYRRLAMQDLARNINLATKRGDNALLAHTHAKHWDLSTEMLDCRIANAGVCLGVTGTRADDQLSRLLGDQVFQRNLIIAKNGNYSTF